MPNTSVFTGADGSITLAAPATPQGEAAKEVLEKHELLSVGRVRGVRVEVRSDVKPFHEIGQRYATELRPGNITIRGTFDRAYLNGALLGLLLGEAASSRPAGGWTQPEFNITLMLQNPATPDLRSTVTLHNVKIDSWVYDMPEDDFVIESTGFQALYLSTQDEP